MSAEVAELYGRHGYILTPEEAATWLGEKREKDQARIAALESLLREIVDVDDAALAEMKACGLRPDNVIVALTEKARNLLEKT